MNIRKLIAKVVENWPVKVLSMGVAIILFVFNRMSTLEERFFSAPLNIELKGTLMPSSSYPRMIRVRLRGEANSIYPILDDDIEVFVNMNEFDAPGTFSVPVQWRKKGTAQGVEPLQITVDPMEISFSLDHKISKFVPITPSLRGQVDSGFTMNSYSLNPNQVIIDGPASLMGGIAELSTELIDLDGRRGNFTGTVQIMNSDPLIVIRGSGTTEFRGVISQIIPVRNINNVPIAVTGLMEGFSGELAVKTGSIHLEGEDQEAVDAFKPPPDFLKVDCSGINLPGTYILRVLAEPAERISLRVVPDEVQIRIIQAEAGSR